MPLLKCPDTDSLFEFVSIPSEMSLWSRANMKTHLFVCPLCQKGAQSIRDKWDAYFTPEPDITGSLIKVYSRLQKDETLVLKGWKLGGVQRQTSFRDSVIGQGWLFRGAVATGLAVVAFFLVNPQGKLEKGDVLATAIPQSAQLPLARFRVEDKNRIKVHYVQPELLQSMEFETTSIGR